MAETHFICTVARTGQTIEALGPEVVRFAGEKIKESPDYHRLTTD
jgi:hypothetical protein